MASTRAVVGNNQLDTPCKGSQAGFSVSSGGGSTNGPRGTPVVDAADVDREAAVEGEEETFLPEEEEDTDVSGFIDGGIGIPWAAPALAPA